MNKNSQFLTHKQHKYVYPPIITMEKKALESVLDAAEDLLAVIPDSDEEVTDSVYAEILGKAQDLDLVKNDL